MGGVCGWVTTGGVRGGWREGSGAAGGDPIAAGTPEAEKLEAALTAVCVGIAKSIAWDGEGATCLIECNVNGADSLDDARLIARSVVSSSL